MLTKRKKQEKWLTQAQFDNLDSLEDGVVYHITDAKVDYDTEVSNRPVLKTDNTTAQATSASETISGTINLHKVAKTGTYSDLIGTPTLGTAAAKDAGTQNGVADLDANGKVPANELPVAENGDDSGGSAGAVKLQGTHYAGISVNITTKNMSIAETTDSDTFWNNRKSYGFAVKGSNIDKYLKLALGSTSAQSDNTTTWTETNKQNACDTLGAERKTLTGSSAPTTSTVGSVGQWYLDTTNNKTYQCTAITSDGATPPTYTYTWEETANKNYVDTNFSKLDASNLSSANITSWQSACGFERVENIPLTNNKIVSNSSQTIDLSKYKRVRCYYRCYSESNANYAADGGIIEMDTTRTPFCAASQALSYNVYNSQTGWSATNSIGINIAYSQSSHNFSVRMFYNGTVQTTNTEYYIYKMEGIY